MSDPGKADPAGAVGQLPTLGEVVEQIARVRADRELTSGNDMHLKRLSQVLRNRKGRFGLVFAVCNDLAEQRQLTRQLIAGLSDLHPVELELSGEEVSLLDRLLEAPGRPEPLVVYGIDRLLPSTESGKIRREQTLHELQLRREQFRFLGRPLLFWMPEYVYSLIGQGAIDFWSWQGGAFFFSTQERAQTPLEDDARQDRKYEKEPAPAVLGAPDQGYHKRQAQLVEEALREGKHVVLQGMAGVGKTSLALAVADRLREVFPDGTLLVAFQEADKDDWPSRGLRQVVRTQSPEAALPEDFVGLVAMYRGVLRGRRVLIIVDDAPDARSVQSFLPPGGSALIVASRRALSLPDAVVVPLDRLSPQEAKELLLSLVPGLAPGDADQVCSVCGYLPLPIRIAGSFLAANPGLDASDYVRELRGTAEAGEQFVRASLDVSHGRLDAEAAAVFHRLGVFTGSFDANAEEVVAADAEHKHLQELCRWGLVWRDQDRRYVLHEVVRLYAAERLSPDERERAGRRHAGYYLKILFAAHDLYEQGGEAIRKGLAVLDAEWENIQAAQAWAAKAAGKDEEAADLCGNFGVAAAALLELRQHPKERVRWVEEGLAAARRLGHSQREARLLISLGRVYSRSDLGRAIDSYRQAAALAKGLGDDVVELHALSNLGAAFESAGDYEQALDISTRLLQVSKKIGRPNFEAEAHYNLGNIYSRLGQSSRATEHFREVLRIAEVTGDLVLKAAALLDLGNQSGMLGHSEESIRYYEEALAISKQLGSRRHELAAVHNLGSAYAALGDWGRAIALYRQALSLAQEAGDRLGEARLLDSLGRAYLGSGEASHALRFLEEALAIMIEVGDRRGEELALRNLGAVSASLGDLRRGIECLDRALRIAREIQDRSGLVVALAAKGALLERLGMAVEAGTHINEARAIHDQLEKQEQEWVEGHVGRLLLPSESISGGS